MMDITKIYQLYKKEILVYGDVIVDIYIEGSVSKISPEAPVPVLVVEKMRKKLGGAANVAENLLSLGANVRVLGYSGQDENGNWLLHRLQDIHADCRYFIQFADYSTISKTRITSNKQQLIRYDIEKIYEPSFQYTEYIKKNVDCILENISALVISDYNKGAVTEVIAQILISEAKKRRIPVIVDPKGKNYYKYRDATLCTPNVKEINLLFDDDLIDDYAIKWKGETVIKDYHFDFLAITRSEKGIRLFSSDGMVDYPATCKDLIDVSGAGDTVVAILACALACDMTVQIGCVLANLAASVVCSKYGTSVLTMEELLKQIAGDGKYKHIGIEENDYILKNLKQNNKKVVFTNGCFDLLHAGHVYLLNQAKSLGDVLIVAVNSDDSVKKNKGKKRPIISEQNRITMLCALECVDYVILMNEKNPVSILKRIKPDIVVKGQDWEDKYMPEQTIVESYGGEIHFVPLKGKLSTTNIIRRIYECDDDFKK